MREDNYILDLNAILAQSCAKGATDVHLCAGIKPLLRLSSKLCPIEEMPVLNPRHIDSLLGNLLDEEKLKQLKKKKVLDLSFSVPGLGRFRVNIYSQRGTFALALRALPFDVPPLESLGLPEIVKSFAHKNRGLILATGAAGSGKSTTLAGLIKIINEEYNYHIITIEDPIEYLHPHGKSLVTQREIGYDTFSFAGALRSALREDPDIILVGEMRDPETIAIALTAAETGHLVLSTLHTIGSAKAIDRIIDAFPGGQQNQIRNQLAAVLEGVISQQLLTSQKSGRPVVAAEVMVVNTAIRNMIREGKQYQINNIMQTGQELGMNLMDSELARLYKEGIISLEEAQKHSQDPSLFQYFLDRS